ncbi:MAG TPA: ATP-binding protein [Allosphingosinicella sp.]|jgi:signal transduction histidine kinase/ActR/RegA family two-component response regulator
MPPRNNSLTRFAARWPNAPLAGGLLALLLLVAGLGVIFLSARNYTVQKRQETEVQAQILAASVTAALDFGDARTAQESVDALGVNPQVSAAGVYDSAGRLFAGYARSPGLLSARFDRRAPRGGNLVEATAPVLRGGQPIGTVYLQAVREPLSRRLARYGVVGLLTLMAALIVLILGIAQTALRRANRELEERAEALSGAYAELQVQVEERTKAEEQLRQAQKMQALGQLTGGIAHDFNNLLTVIQGSADILRRPGLDEEKRVRFAGAIAQTATRAAALTSQLLAFARRQPLQPQVLDVNEQIVEMTELLDRALGERIAIRTELGADLCAIEADPAQLESAILNIAVNARDAMLAKDPNGGGTLTLATGDDALPDGRRAVAISVADTGTGIPEEMLEHVFEPFFTTKSVGRGTGLGLSQVYGFATQSDGDIRVESEVGRGTKVILLLPCSAKTETRKEIRGGGHEGAARAAHILVVDDNEPVGLLAEALMQELGHRVTRAHSGLEALRLAQRTKFEIVFTDVVMPGMSGLDLAERLAHVLPGVPVVLTTGFSDEIARAGTGGRPVLFKPYRLDALAEMLDSVLAAGDRQAEDQQAEDQ